VLERCKEIKLSKDIKELLSLAPPARAGVKISSASIDRCLRPVRIKSPHGLSTTKPGRLLKKPIAVRTFTERDEEHPGFMEIDLLAHCGDSVAGQFLRTLTYTDICTGWTDVTGLLHRSQQAVSEAIRLMRQRLPFPLLGIVSDNGGGFTLALHASAGVNDLLYQYCLDEEITFNQAHVEQKNWFGVQRIDNQTLKRYDPAKTPYQRALERKDISLDAKTLCTTS
jgi:hypothetical protein